MIDIYWAYLLEKRLKKDLYEKNSRKKEIKKETKTRKDIHKNCPLCGQNNYFCICNLYL